MQRRRVMLAAGKKPRQLPQGYRQAKYLQTDGHAYLSIPVTNFSGTTIRYKTKFKLLTAAQDKAICAFRNCFLSQNVGRFRILNYSFNNGFAEAPVRPTAEETYEIEAWQNGIDLYINANGLSSTGITNKTEFVSDHFTFFALDYYGNYGTIAQFEYVQAFASIDDSAPLCDLVPCERESDGEPGMHDFISREFYANAGPGAFTIGPYVN